MYRPSYSTTDDQALAAQLIQEFPLGLLISQSEGVIDTSYLPFLAKIENSELIITTHMARANPQWKTFGTEICVSFLGPQRYISPRVYNSQNNVPTWNYATVQVRGRPELITSKEGINQLLKESVKEFEARNGTDWNYDLPESQQQKLEAAIIGIRVRAVGITKVKLSQNRSQEDRKLVMRFLKFSEDPADLSLYRWMAR